MILRLRPRVAIPGPRISPGLPVQPRQGDWATLKHEIADRIFKLMDHYAPKLQPFRP